MPNKNSLMVFQVSGENIVFRNFRGNPTPVLPKGGDRSFCLIIPNRLIRDQLAARGCNIKKLKNGTEFVNVAVRIVPTEQENAICKADNIWQALDVDEIDNASLEFTFYEYNINGKKGTRIYLKNASFCVKDLFAQTIIDIRWPNTINVTNIKTYSTNNTNNTEETNMEKMTRAEVMGQLQMGITAFEMEERNKTDPVVSKIIHAMKNAIEYIGEVPKNEIKVKTVTVEKRVPVTPEIKQVIFNDQTTVVIWFDDVKTVVKCQKGDTFDKEKGLAMAICKRLFGNESNFNNLIKKYVNDDKNVQTKKKVKEGTFAERKAERMAQAEANKTAKGKSKAGKKKALDKARKNTKTMVVLTEAYRTKLRIKMAEKGWTYAQVAEKAGLGKSTVTRLISTAKQKFMPTRIRRDVFDKLNTALGIRWKV